MIIQVRQSCLKVSNPDMSPLILFIMSVAGAAKSK